MSSDAKLLMVRTVLRWAWDPIGVRGIPEAADEYDDYAPTVLDLLEAGATDEQIADHLTNIVRSRMELPGNKILDGDVASMLRELHSILLAADIR